MAQAQAIMATGTKNKSSEEQRTAVSIQETQPTEGPKKQHRRHVADKGGVFCSSENPEKLEQRRQNVGLETPVHSATTEDPVQNVNSAMQEPNDGVPDKAAQSGTTVKPMKGNASEQPEQNGTAERSERGSASQKDSPQLKKNTKKALRFGPSQRNRSGPRAKNGSYHNYYKRRYNGIHGDDRLPIVRDAIKLQGKNVSLLDVGCNDGTVTIEMASLDRCIEAVGIDIDPNLVGAARKSLRKIVEKESGMSEAECANPNIQGPVPTPSDAFPLSLRRSLHLMKVAKGKEGGNSPGCADVARFPHNVTFRREDFAQRAPTRTSQEIGKYDVVMCLSVTKWVHFAGGDEALKRLFRRLHACLKPGGVLILEPQPQKSYKSAIRKGLGKKDFRGERKLKPPKFAEYLLKTVRFSKMKMLRDVRHRGHAFNRPILAFYKRQERFPSSVGLALSHDADAFLGVVPSDEEEDEHQQLEEQDAPARDASEEEQGAMQNGMVVENVNVGEVEEVREGRGERDENDDRKADNGVETSDGQKKQQSEDREELESALQPTSAGPITVEGASAPGVKKKDETQFTRSVEASSPKNSDSQVALLTSSGSKRRSAAQDVEGVKAQSPKRSKHDDGSEVE